MNIDATDSFISATNFCTGSQTDYSTCIANNMRFTPFTDDTYGASKYAGVHIKTQDLPLLFGDIYVDLSPLAIANILTRVKMTNSYGGVSFRCSDVFNNPRLPLPRLQDLGIPAQELVNVIGVDPEDADGDDTYNGVPISVEYSILGWLFNVYNLTLGYSTAVSNVTAKGKEIKGVILGMLDYYSLPSLSEDMYDEVVRASGLYNQAQGYTRRIRDSAAADSLLVNTMEEVLLYLNQSKLYLDDLIQTTNNDVKIPLSVINDNTDFTTFDYTITDGVADAITIQERDQYPYIFDLFMQAKKLTAIYGVPPEHPKDTDIVNNNTLDTYGGSTRVFVSDSLSLIRKFYTISDSLLEDSINTLKGKQTFYDFFKAHYRDIPATTDKYQAMKDQMVVTLNTFTFANLVNDLAGTNQDQRKVILDTYYRVHGNVANIETYNLVTKQQELYNINQDDRITEVYLGGDYKDAGKFYYADIAYAVGYGKLTNIKSIQIDDEYYELNNISGGISESGCTKYTFSRHVLPTYTVDVHMYIYPGTPDQPYCPTINKYHNFLTSKYSGIFTKMDVEDMGLYIFKGYKPMQQTVEEVIQVGAMDLNSINLNDPSLDTKAVETMIMREVKNLTNASSINNKPLSTADFKYYMAAELIDETVTANYPGMAIIEFKGFPLGSAIKFPKITINVEAGDLV